jgi:Pathogenicity locus
MMTKQSALKELQVIPGIGKKMAEELWNLGIHTVSDLKDRDPEELYLQQCDRVGMKVDRCVLYTYRCAVYYASSPQHDPDLLKWWNWKDRTEAPLSNPV